MESHLNYILNQARMISKTQNELTIPTLFEYFCAYNLSTTKNKIFNVWKDVHPNLKAKFGFPNSDKGVDTQPLYFSLLYERKILNRQIK